MNIALLLAVIIGLASFLFISKKADTPGFFSGFMENKQEPTLLVITFSQVTTWIFSRSLLTAAILAYYYGLPGALAYTAYYISFLTGGYFVLSIRKKFKANSIMEFVVKEYGIVGKLLYSFIVIIRLISEIFANLIVIGLIFGNEGSKEYNISIILVMCLAFSYSYMGGFRNSIKTDFFQMIVFIILMLFLVVGIIFSNISINNQLFFSKITDYSNPGYALIGVALLQVWSYPLHDPVMMDRGFICNYKKTKISFCLAFLISSSCIFIFSLLGIFLANTSIDGITFIEAIKSNFGHNISYIVFLLLIVSSMSTLDSTLSSSSKLIVLDLGLLTKTIFNGRLVMLLFSVLGLAFIFLNTKDLFTAVAVSGTAATFLTSTFILRVIFNIILSKSSLIMSFILSICGSIIYFLESQSLNNSFSLFFALEHKYKTLLVINIIILVLSFLIGLITRKNIKHNN